MRAGVDCSEQEEDLVADQEIALKMKGVFGREAVSGWDFHCMLFGSIPASTSAFSER